ncbi:MAG: hypothetical protein K6E72_00640 [Saccharofermentans sp.]|nr:hypothetical protein [Saccharofermentans sp.]
MNERSIILDACDNKMFHTIYEAINYCVGTSYTGWMKACWPTYLPQDGFRIWFVKLAIKKNGEFIPGVNGCINKLIDNGDCFIFDDLRTDNAGDGEERYWGYDLLFTKELGEDYRFSGVYIKDRQQTRPYHSVSRRVATRVELLGNPARKLVLLDAIEFSQNNDDINIPMNPQSRIQSPDGLLSYICGRCGMRFVKSPRCPECGQLVKE